MPPHDHERPTLYLGASLAFERTTEHKSFRIPGTPVSSVNTGWEASEISIRDSIRSATKLDNFCGAGATIFAPIRHATVASPACVVNWTVYRSCVTALIPRLPGRCVGRARRPRADAGSARSRGRVLACRGARAGSRRVSRFRVLVRLLSVLPGPGTPPEASAARRRTDYGASRLREPSAPARPRRRAAWRPRVAALLSVPGWRGERG